MMNRAPQGRGQPRLGATWYPGGQDDFYMPEVISPSPQRCVLSVLVKIVYGLPSSCWRLALVETWLTSLRIFV